MEHYIGEPQDITPEFKMALFQHKCMCSLYNSYALKRVRWGNMETFNNYWIVNGSKRFFLTQKMPNDHRTINTHIHLN